MVIQTLLYQPLGQMEHTILLHCEHSVPKNTIVPKPQGSGYNKSFLPISLCDFGYSFSSEFQNFQTIILGNGC